VQVLSSRFEAGVPQHDGRRYVHEWHELDTGEVYEREYGPVDVSLIDPGAVAENFARQMEADAAREAQGSD
jgi:hypothetical protein